MTERTVLPAPAAPAAARLRRRPVTATASAVLQLAMGTLTSVAGAIFSAAEGGTWLVATPLFVIALVLWWMAAVGLLRGSQLAHRLGIGTLVAFFSFGIFKIVVYHEVASWYFQGATLLILALHLAPATRRFVRRCPPRRLLRIPDLAD